MRIPSTALVAATLCLSACAERARSSGASAQRHGSAGPSAATVAGAPAAPLTPPPANPTLHTVTTATRVDDPTLAPEFNNLYADGDIYFSGWPTEAGLRMMAARGVRTIIALKTPEEVQDARNYDPRKVAAELGVNLVVIPVHPSTYSAADIQKFAAAFESANGGVLIHCGSSSTVGCVWSGYLVAKRGMSAADALDRGRAAGLKDGPMSDAAERVANDLAAKR